MTQKAKYWFSIIGLVFLGLSACGAEASPEIIPLLASDTPVVTQTPIQTVSPTLEIFPTVTLAPTRTPLPTGEAGAAPTIPILPTFTPAPVTMTATFELRSQVLRIEYFASNTNNPIANGDSLTLFWRVVGSPEARIFQLNEQNRRTQVWNVQAEGAISVRVRADEGDTRARFLIQAEYRDTVVEDSLEIPLLGCSTAWFFDPQPLTCALGPAENTGQVEQRFENGRMIWVAIRQEIYVLDAQAQTWQSFPDQYTAEQAERDDSLLPPPERFQPIRGFGLIWRENPSVQARLGWAVEPEFGYDGLIQAGNDDIIYLRVSDGVLALREDTWEILTPTP